MLLPARYPAARMQHRLEVISGGQTGVDRGALDAALDAGVPCGGWCPRGRVAEDGRIPERYPLRELAGGYDERTRRNVEDSDGTLIIHCGSLSGGTLATLEFCVELRKPFLLVDGSEVVAVAGAVDVRRFVAENRIQRLNVAGPRESGWPAASAYAYTIVRASLPMTDDAASADTLQRGA